jgi:serine/threonine-protein kinase
MAYTPKPNIPGYELIEKIGQGGMGTVWKAVQKSLNRTVAIKVLAPHLVNDAKYLERFEREIRAAAKLTHPNIVQIFEASHIGDLHYFVMEYVEGRPLRRRLLEMGRMAEKESFRVAQQIANALDYAWNTARLIHRDIKPDNILLTRSGDAKLTDLGLVKTAFSEEDAEMMKSGMTVGTPNYMSPEQAQGSPDVDTRSDLYSLGATLFQLLTGRVPYALETSSQVMAAHVHQPFPDPRAINPHLSDGACGILAKLMAKEPAARYQTGAELAADIERFLAGETPQAILEKNPPPPQRNTRRLALAIAGGAVMLVAALAAFNWYYSNPAWKRHQTPRQNLPSDPDAPRRAFESALQFTQQHADQYNETLNFLDDIAPQVAGTIYESALRQLVGETLRRREAAAAQLFERLQTQSRPLADAEQFTDAAAVFEKFPVEFKDTLVAARVAAAQNALRTQAQQRLAQLTTATQDAIKENRLDDARRLIADIEAVQSPQVASLLNLLRAELAKGPPPPPANGASEPSPQTIYEQHFLPDYERAIKARRFTQAVALCETWLRDPQREALREQIELHARDARLLEKLFAAAAAAAPSLADEQLRIGNHVGKVIKATTESVTVRAEDGAENTFHIEDLPAATVGFLARRSADNARVAELALGAGLLLWQEGDSVSARAQFAAAEQLGADASPYLAHITAVEKLQRETNAAVAVESLKALVEKQSWQAARAQLELLGELFADTEAFKSAQSELKALSPKIADNAHRVDVDSHAAACRDLVAQRNGRVLSVNPNGGGDYKTIAEALARAKDGDGIELADGVYEEANLTSVAKNLLIFGRSGAMPVVTARSLTRDVPLFSVAEGWEFDNLFFDIRASAAVPRPVAIQIAPRPAQRSRVVVRLSGCVVAGNGIVVRQQTAASVTLEDCLVGFGAQSGLLEPHELGLTVQHCTVVNAAPLLQMPSEREAECSIKFWDNVILGPFAALTAPWRERSEVPRAIIYYGDYNLFLSRTVNGRFDLSDDNAAVATKTDATQRSLDYDEWARLFALDRASYGFISTKPTEKNDSTLKYYAPLFVAPLDGDFRLRREKAIRGSDDAPVGVRWAPWQWQGFQKQFRAMELK